MADGGRGWADIVNPRAIAIHHTAARFFPRPDPTPADELAHLRMIDAYHVSQGYGAFGYHLAVFPSTRAYWCGTLERARAHVKYRNHELIGVVAIGDFSADVPTSEHRRAVVGAGNWIRDVTGRMLPIDSHKRLADPRSPTACPGVWPWPPTDTQEVHPLSALKPDEQRALFDRVNDLWNAWVGFKVKRGDNPDDPDAYLDNNARDEILKRVRAQDAGK